MHCFLDTEGERSAKKDPPMNKNYLWFFPENSSEQRVTLYNIFKMDIIKKQVDELMDNQTHILAAIQYLDERMKVIENTSDEKSDDV